MSSLSAYYESDLRVSESILSTTNVTPTNTSNASQDNNLAFDQMCFPDLDRLSHCIVVFVLALIGLMGNISLLLVIVRNKNLHSAPNILIVNLIIGDLLYILTTAPFNIRHEIYACWLLGSIACKIKHFLPIVAQAACIFSLVALSRDRYNAIVNGLETHAKREVLQGPALTVALSWMLGCIIGIPVFYFTETRASGLLCQFMPMGDDIKCKIYMLISFCILYIVPCVIIAYHYIHIARSLVQSGIVTLTDNTASIQQLRSRRRLALIVIIITLFFGLFWLPYHVYHIWYIFTRYAGHIKLNTVTVQMFRHFYTYSSLANSCINPWIVFCMSSAHRKGFYRRIICDYGREIPKKINKQVLTLQKRSTCVRASTSSSNWKNNQSSSGYPPTVLHDQTC